MKCKNCGHNIGGNFCENCGQKSNIERINFKYILDEFSNTVLQINHGFLYTVKELFIRPGHSIKDFIDGKRKKFYKPLAFAFITATIYFFFNNFIGNDTFVNDAINGWNDQNNNEKAYSWISENQVYIILLIVPFFSVASYLSFFKSRYNYFEHFVLNVYITGQQMIIYLIFSFITNRDFATIPLLLGIVFNIWSYSQFFNNKSKLKKMLLIVLTYLIFILEIIIVMIVSIGIWKLIK